jgi:hypothetical protein
MRRALFLVLLLLAGCDKPGEWSAIVYPDRSDRTRFDVTSRFQTFSTRGRRHRADEGDRGQPLQR